ncbi:MAG: hypothetical protein Q8P97_00010 [bacterium]|nr:hypothetical protein [bacterium]
MLTLFIIRFVLGAVLFATSLFARPRALMTRFEKWLLPALGVIIFSVLFYFTREQFLYWHGSVEFGRAFVPPYSPTGIGYFLSFVFYHLFGEFIFSFLGACLFLLCAPAVNKRYGERFFYEDELYLGACGIFLVGYPSLVYYLFLFFGVYLALHLITRAYARESIRISPYYLWLPLALFLIVAQYFFIDYWPHLSIFVL